MRAYREGQSADREGIVLHGANVQVKYRELIQPYIENGLALWSPGSMAEHPFVTLSDELEGYHIHRKFLSELLRRFRALNCSTGLMRQVPKLERETSEKFP